MTWREKAECAEAFGLNFTDPSSGYELATCLSVCVRCPVRAECLAEATADPYATGVWGGAHFGRPDTLAVRIVAIRPLYDDGLNDVEIAARLGLTVDAVVRARGKAGLSRAGGDTRTA